MFQNFKVYSIIKMFINHKERFESYNHDVYTEDVNKIALSSNEDKRLQTFDEITTSIWKKCF